MSKVLSTKLAVDEVDRFSAAAEQQGLSKAGLLKNLVEEYLGGSNEENEAISNTELLAELRRTVRALQNQLALKATTSEINLIATKVELLSKRVEKHERWFNPESIDEVFLETCGGPIAYLEKRLRTCHPADR
ncbi:hypothetical protein ES703_05781 [subsurface metagenome]